MASMALCEAAAYYKLRGKTIWDAMLDMYEKYGYYKDNVIAITHKGIEGLQKIQSIMDNLRKNPPMKFGNYDVTAVRDYLKDEIVNVKTCLLYTSGYRARGSFARNQPGRKTAYGAWCELCL